MRLIDCHCHLDDRKYDADREEIIARNRGRVEAIITSGVSLASNSATLALAKKHPAFVFASLGLSPAFVGEMTDADVDAVIEQVRANARRIVAVGEVGLDYYWEKHSAARERQQKVFRQFIALAKELDKPLVVHCRDADSDCWRIVEESPPHVVVFHHFSAPADYIPRLVKNGFYASVGTIALISRRHASLIKQLPAEYTLTETDSPYNSSVRGERNEPFQVAGLINLIASMKGLDANVVSDAVRRNASRAFSV